MSIRWHSLKLYTPSFPIFACIIFSVIRQDGFPPHRKNQAGSVRNILVKYCIRYRSLTTNFTRMLYIPATIPCTLWGLTNCAYVRLGLRICLHVPDSTCYSPTEADTNRPLFCRRYFKIHFPEWEVLYFDDSFAEICFQGPPKNSIPLSEPLLA